MPHESTTEPEDIKFQEDEDKLEQMRTRSRSLPAESINHQPQVPGRRSKALSLVAETPMRITHHHDDDDDEDTAAEGTAT